MKNIVIFLRLAGLLMLIIFAQPSYAIDNVPVGQSKIEPVPEGQGIGADIFGEKGGRFHPFLILQGVYSDNLYSTNNDTKSDFVTTASPGFWIAFPANRERLLQLSTTTTAPGGMQINRTQPEYNRRYQAYFLYSPEFVLYADNSSQDHANHKAEAMLQYNLKSGLSFDLIDLFNDREEIAGNGVTDTLYRHQDNLLDLMATYTSRSEKLRVQLDYSNYYLDYEDSAVSYRSRTDNSFGASVFYKFWPKTSVFLEYDRADIEFDTDSTNNSTENRFYGGLNWEITAKTKGSLKLGFIDKDFDSSSVDDQDGFSLEVQTQFNLTSKRALQINAYRKFHESDLANASSFLSTGTEIALLQRFSEKWTGTLTAFYETNEYNGFNRDDDYFGLGPAVRFKPRKWMIFDMGYMYYSNSSNITLYDYDVNLLFLRATITM